MKNRCVFHVSADGEGIEHEHVSKVGAFSCSTSGVGKRSRQTRKNTHAGAFFVFQLGGVGGRAAKHKKRAYTGAFFRVQMEGWRWKAWVGGAMGHSLTKMFSKVNKLDTNFGAYLFPMAPVFCPIAYRRSGGALQRERARGWSWFGMCSNGENLITRHNLIM